MSKTRRLIELLDEIDIENIKDEAIFRLPVADDLIAKAFNIDEVTDDE